MKMGKLRYNQEKVKCSECGSDFIKRIKKQLSNRIPAGIRGVNAKTCSKTCSSKRRASQGKTEKNKQYQKKYREKQKLLRESK